MGIAADSLRAPEGLRPRDARRAVGERRRHAVPPRRVRRGRRLRAADLHVRRGRRPVVAVARPRLAAALRAAAGGRPPHVPRGGRGEAAAGARRSGDQPGAAGALRRHISHAAGPGDGGRRTAGAAGLPRPAGGNREGDRHVPAAVAVLRPDAGAAHRGIQADLLRLELRVAPRRRVPAVPQPARGAARGHAPRVDPDPHGGPAGVARAGAVVGRRADLAERRGGRHRGRPRTFARGDRALPRSAADRLPGDGREGRARPRRQPRTRQRHRRMDEFPRRRRPAVRRPRRDAGRGGDRRRRRRAAMRCRGRRPPR